MSLYYGNCPRPQIEGFKIETLARCYAVMHMTREDKWGWQWLQERVLYPHLSPNDLYHFKDCKRAHRSYALSLFHHTLQGFQNILLVTKPSTPSQPHPAGKTPLFM